jgi:hypothetical protein
VGVETAANNTGNAVEATLADSRYGDALDEVERCQAEAYIATKGQTHSKNTSSR